MTVQNSSWATIFPGLLQNIVEEAGDDTAARCANVCKDWFAALSPTLPDDRRTRASQAELQQLAKVTDYKALIPAFWFLDAESQRKLLFKACKNDDVALVRKLLASSAIDLTTKDPEGNTLLHLAAGSRYFKTIYVEMVRVLLEGGKADPNAQDNYGRTPLHDAAFTGNVEIAKLLLADDRVDPDVPDIHGRSPLVDAVWNGSYDMVKLLLADKRVQPDGLDNGKKRAVDWAADTGSYGLVQIFIRNGTDPRSLSGVGRMEPAWTVMMAGAARTALEKDLEAMEPDSGEEDEIDLRFCGATAEPAEADEVGPLAEGDVVKSASEPRPFRRLSYIAGAALALIAAWYGVHKLRQYWQMPSATLTR